MSSILIASRPARRVLAGQALGALAAFASGLLLALMIAQNGALARATDPWLASWLAHGVGTLMAALLWTLASRYSLTGTGVNDAGSRAQAPRW